MEGGVEGVRRRAKARDGERRRAKESEGKAKVLTPPECFSMSVHFDRAQGDQAADLQPTSRK